MASLPPGSSIGPFPYRIVQGIGEQQGGMSEVYMAHAGAAEPDARVILKIARVRDEAHDQFYETGLLNEVKHLRELKHRGIVHIYPILSNDLPNLPYRARATALDGRPWFCVLEYLPGGSLADLLEKHPQGLPLGLALEIAYNLSSTFDYLHSRKVVHTDIKPPNILFRQPPEERTLIDPVMIDFGIARQEGQDVIGRSREYLAPELIPANRTDTETRQVYCSRDVHTLGIIIYEMVTGRHPFSGQDRRSTTEAILAGRPAPPSEFFAGQLADKRTALALDDLILNALDTDPARRPTASGLAMAIEQASFRLGYPYRTYHLIPDPSSALVVPREMPAPPTPVVAPLRPSSASEVVTSAHGSSSASAADPRPATPAAPPRPGPWRRLTSMAVPLLLMFGLGLGGGVGLGWRLAGADARLTATPSATTAHTAQQDDGAVTADSTAPATTPASTSTSAPASTNGTGVMLVGDATAPPMVRTTAAITAGVSITMASALTVTPAITPTATPTLAPLWVTLIAPEDGTKGVGTVDFRWRPVSGQLASSQQYRIVICKVEINDVIRAGFCNSPEALFVNHKTIADATREEQQINVRVKDILVGWGREFPANDRYYWGIAVTDQVGTPLWMVSTPSVFIPGGE